MGLQHLMGFACAHQTHSQIRKQCSYRLYPGERKGGRSTPGSPAARTMLARQGPGSRSQRLRAEQGPCPRAPTAQPPALAGLEETAGPCLGEWSSTSGTGEAAETGRGEHPITSTALLFPQPFWAAASRTPPSICRQQLRSGPGSSPRGWHGSASAGLQPPRTRVGNARPRSSSKPSKGARNITKIEAKHPATASSPARQAAGLRDPSAEKERLQPRLWGGEIHGHRGAAAGPGRGDPAGRAPWLQ